MDNIDLDEEQLNNALPDALQEFYLMRRRELLKQIYWLEDKLGMPRSMTYRDHMRAMRVTAGEKEAA